MKTVETLKERDYEPQFEALLRELLGRVPSLKRASLKKDAHVSTDSPDRADRVAHVVAGDRKWTLIVEEKRLGQPREVRSTVLQLERYLKHLPEDVPHYGLLLAPFISQESARICTEAGIGYADLAGNARLAFDQVFIETRGADNPFREKRETRSLFAPRATRVLRVLLQGPLRPWKVTELAEKLQTILKEEQPLFTQWFAGWLRHPYTMPVVVTTYVKQFPDESIIKEKLLGRRVSAGGGGLRLVLPKEEGVFHPLQTVRGFNLVSDVQIYIDLLHAGLRGEEQAEELRRWPDFAGGWT